MTRPVTPIEAARRRKICESREPMRLADHLLTECYRDAQGCTTIARWRGDFYSYDVDAGVYVRLPTDALHAVTYNLLDKTDVPVEHQGQVIREPIKPNKRLVTEVLGALVSRGILLGGDGHEWLENPMGRPSASDLLVCSNGLLEISERRIHPATPEFFALNGTSVVFDPDAPSPECWLEFLDDLWGSDVQSIRLLQEWIGYLLTRDTSQQKIMMVVGQKRAGKGTIARIVTELVGAGAVAAPTLTDLGRRFGKENLIGRRLAIIGDARIGRRADHAVLAETLLSVSGEDGIDVDRKGRPVITLRLPTRFMVVTNELPLIVDSSGALPSRFLILQLTRSFYGREDRQLFHRLRAEASGILNWALDGLERLNERGHFVQCDAAADAVRELTNLASPIKAFIADRISIEPASGASDLWESSERVWSEWEQWTEEQAQANSLSKIAFFRRLCDALPSIKRTKRTVTSRLHPEGKREPGYSGLKLVDPE